MFKYDWSLIDIKTGLIFMAGVWITFTYMGGGEFAWYAAGTAALLAWCTILLVPPQSRRRDFAGLFVYLVGGAAMTWLGWEISGNPVAVVISMFVVTFAAYSMLMIGGHEFMVGWCVVYWLMLIPLFVSGQTLEGLLKAHVLGTGVVIALNILKPLWDRKPRPEPTPADPVDRGFMTRYAGIVATAIAGGTALGTQLLTVDPTVVANATINIISPSLKVVWRNAVERVVLAFAGLIIGFYLGWFFPGDLFGNVLTAVTAFAALAMVRVSFSILMFFLFMMLAYPWGVMHTDAGHLIANEKLIGELIGIVMAIVAIGLLTRLKRTRTA